MITSKSIKYLRDNFFYILGRLFLIGSKPLILLSINYWAGNNLASLIAQVFLISMLFAAFTNLGAYVPFYKSFFNYPRKKDILDTYQKYLNAILFQILTIIPFFIIINLYFIKDLKFIFLFFLFFVSERLFDEIQRFLIFKNSLNEWGIKNLVKSLIQIIGVIISVQFINDYTQYLTLSSLILGNFLIYGSKISFKQFYFKNINIKEFLHIYRSQFFRWMLSSVSSLVIYLDRIIVMFFRQSDLAIYTILVSGISFIQFAVDYFFLTLIRKDILKNKVTLRHIFIKPLLYKIIFFSAIIGVLVSWFMIYLYHGRQLDISILFLIVLLSQITLSFTMIVQEIIYWNYNLKQQLLVEIFFIIFSLLCIGLIYLLGLGLTVMFGVILLLLIIRFFLMTLIISKLSIVNY